MNSYNAPARFNGNKNTMFTSSINNTRSIADRIKTLSLGLSLLVVSYASWKENSIHNYGGFVGTLSSILTTLSGASLMLATFSNDPVFEEEHSNPAPK